MSGFLYCLSEVKIFNSVNVKSTESVWVGQQTCMLKSRMLSYLDIKYDQSSENSWVNAVGLGSPYVACTGSFIVRIKPLCSNYTKELCDT